MKTPTLTAPVGGSGERKICPQGMHVARCYQVIDLGTTEQGGNFPGKRRKVQLLFETPFETAVFTDGSGEQPYYVRNMYTLSMNEKAILRKDVTSWLGIKMTDKEASSFNVFSLLGKECQVNIVHTTKGDNTYANITAITPLAKGMTCPPPTNPLVAFSCSTPDMDIFNTLPDFIKDKIKESDEFIAYMDAAMNEQPMPTTPPRQEPPKPNKAEADVWGALGEEQGDGLPF